MPLMVSVPAPNTCAAAAPPFQMNTLMPATEAGRRTESPAVAHTLMKLNCLVSAKAAAWVPPACAVSALPTLPL
jgi:hypothetical protein